MSRKAAADPNYPYDTYYQGDGLYEIRDVNTRQRITGSLSLQEALGDCAYMNSHVRKLAAAADLRATVNRRGDPVEADLAAAEAGIRRAVGRADELATLNRLQRGRTALAGGAK